MWRLALTFLHQIVWETFLWLLFLGRKSVIRIGWSLGVDGKLVQYAFTPFLSFLSVWVRPQPDLRHGQAFDTLSKNIYLPSLYLHRLVKYKMIHSKLYHRMCSTSLNLIWMNFFDKSSSIKIFLFFTGQFWSPFWNAAIEWSWRAMTPPLGRWNKNDSGDSQDIFV